MVTTTLTQRLPLLQNKYVRMAILAVAIVLFALVSGFSYAYLSTPAAIRSPQFEHLHFRLLMTIDGKAVNFAGKTYQQGYSADNCNAALTLNPFHFHDNKDQFVHVHWKDMTGGMLLKYYGMNKIGGVDGMLGMRFDSFPNLQTVPIHGMDLPKPKNGDRYYVYSGDGQNYGKRTFSEFTDETIETFFGTKSNVKPDEAASLLDKLFPKAYAHNGVDHDAVAADGSRSLEEINNLMGSVVIFIQKQPPTAAQVKDKFDHLAPLSDSACAG